jgi:hypothetical protein
VGHGCDIQRCTCHSQLIFAVSSPFYEELLPSVQGCHTNRRRLKSTAAVTKKREMLAATHAVRESTNRLFTLRILLKTTICRSTIFQVFFPKCMEPDLRSIRRNNFPTLTFSIIIPFWISNFFQPVPCLTVIPFRRIPSACFVPLKRFLFFLPTAVPTTDRPYTS